MADDIKKLAEALRKEREGHKATKEKLVAITTRITEIEALGVNPNAAQLSEHIANSVKAGVAAESTALASKIKHLETQLAEANATTEAERGKLASRTVADEIRDACRAQHVKPEAFGDAIAIGSTELQLKDGVVQTADGLSAADWIEARKAISGYWWPAARGAGAGRGSIDGPVVTLDNPFARETFSLTKQGNLVLSDPARAERLKSEAAAMSRQ